MATSKRHNKRDMLYLFLIHRNQVALIIHLFDVATIKF